MTIKYNTDCEKLIKFQQSHAEFGAYIRTFDLWAKVINRHVMLTSNSTMLEIGCGLGVPSLNIHLETGCTSYLLDKSVDLDSAQKPSWSNHSINGGIAYSCDLEITKNLFIDNGAQMEKIHFIEKDALSWDEIPPLDFVLSKSSWGVHYHLDDYWDDVTAKLKPDGIAILNLYTSELDYKATVMFAHDYHIWLEARGWKLVLIGKTEVEDMKIYKVRRL